MDSVRPFEVISGVTNLINHDIGQSFPSGHASFIFALAAAVLFYYPKISILFFIAAILTGLGRIIAGVHYPSDILAGAVIGIITAFGLQKIYKKLRKEKAA